MDLAVSYWMKQVYKCLNEDCKLKRNCRRSIVNIGDAKVLFILNSNGTCNNQIKIKNEYIIGN